MTYRRLFLYLFLLSTLALAFLWWHSFRTQWVFVAGARKPSLTFQAQLLHATVRLHWAEIPWSRFFYQFRSIPPEADTLFGATPQGLFGGFGWHDEYENSTIGSFQYRGVLFPIWIPWILFVGSSFAFCRVMERRSDGVKEKELAGEQVAEKLGRETD